MTHILLFLFGHSEEWLAAQAVTTLMVHKLEKNYYSEPNGLTGPHVAIFQLSGRRLTLHYLSFSLACVRHMDRLQGFKLFTPYKPTVTWILIVTVT